MAEDDDWTDEEEGGDVELGAQKAGVAFRAEMWATDFLMRNWMYIVVVLVTLLVSVFIYGQYANFARNQQLFAARMVAEKEIRLPGAVGEISSLMASGQTVDKAELAEVAAALEAIEATGAAKAEALVKASELYRLADKPEDHKRTLEGVSQVGVDPMSTLASIALANLELEAGQGDAATQRLQALSNRTDYLGEQAAIDLGMMYEHLGDKAGARGVYDGFATRFPESPRVEMVRKRRDALGEG